MGGIIIHTIVALLCLLIVQLIHFKWEFSLSIFVGNFLPDVIKFGFSAIKQGTFQIFEVEQDSFYHFLNSVTSDLNILFTLGFFTFGTGLWLYHFHYIKKKKMEEYDELYVFLLIGIIIHLILDALFVESSIWL